MSLVKGIGFERIEKKLQAVESATEVRDILDTAGAFLLHRIKERFLAQVDRNGIPWKPSKASIQRKKSGRDGGTLYQSGTLFHSIKLGRDTPTTRSIFTEVPYARKHNEGLDGMEKREFLAFGLDDKLAVHKLLERRIKEALR